MTACGPYSPSPASARDGGYRGISCSQRQDLYKVHVDLQRARFVDLISETVQRRWRPRLAFRRSSQMHFMFIVKSAHAGPPTPALLKAMDKLADREIKAGRLLDHGGLMPLATGAQGRIADGQLGVTDGPFVGAKEGIGGPSTFRLPRQRKGLVSAHEVM